MTLKFVIILQNLIKAYHRKSGKSKYDRKLTELDVEPHGSGPVWTGYITVKNLALTAVSCQAHHKKNIGLYSGFNWNNL